MNYFDIKSNYYFKQNYNSIHKIFKLREIDYFKKIIKIINLKKNSDILEIGSGTATYSKLLVKYKFKSITCLDESKAMLQNIGNKDIKKINANFMNYKTKKKFDVILALGVSEFIKSYSSFLNKINFFSKKKSTIVLLLPCNNILSYIYKIYHLINSNNITIHNIDKIISKLKKLGWSIIIKKKIIFFSIFIIAQKK
jgi:trans-aconitate methyltransferase